MINRGLQLLNGEFNMYQPTIITWILIIFGLITCLPLMFAQLIMLIDPYGDRAKNMLIGKGEEWRDKTHFKSQYSLALADWLIFIPLFISGITGILMGRQWGYLLFAASAAIQLYTNIFLWFLEKEYVYPAQGALKYYTYYWGNFIYWSAAVLIYAVLRYSGFNF
jgi:hypothetical protein